MYICNVHDNIKCNLNNILDKINSIIIQMNNINNLSDLNTIVDEVAGLKLSIRENLDDIQIAKIMAKDMENRLVDYCNSIENLGFKRTK